MTVLVLVMGLWVVSTAAAVAGFALWGLFVLGRRLRARVRARLARRELVAGAEELVRRQGV